MGDTGIGDDTISGMEIVENFEFNLGDIDDDVDRPNLPPPPVSEPTDAPFHDFFSVSITPVTEDEARRFCATILEDKKINGTDGDSLEKTLFGTLNELKGKADPTLAKAMELIANRLLKVEDTIHKLTDDEPDDTVTCADSICLTISENGMRVGVYGDMPDSANFLVSVNRPWVTPMNFSAVAEVKPIGSIESVSIADLFFTAITDDAKESIARYVDSSQSHFGLLKGGVSL